MILQQQGCKEIRKIGKIDFVICIYDYGHEMDIHVYNSLYGMLDNWIFR